MERTFSSSLQYASWTPASTCDFECTDTVVEWGSCAVRAAIVYTKA